jgi:transcriptional regulator with XRE-family HTH domain
MRTKILHPTDKNVGSRVRSRRMVLGMSQTDLGGALGVTFQQIQKYEKGTNRIGAGRLHRLAEVLKVDPAFFFEGEMGQMAHTSPSPDYLTEFLATPEGLGLMNAFRSVPTAKLRRNVIALVQALADRDD